MATPPASLSACGHQQMATSLPHQHSQQQMQHEMFKTLLMMQIGMSSGASTRKTSTELVAPSRPASTMAARVLGEFCIRVGRKPLRHKSVASDPLRSQTAQWRRSVMHFCMASAQDCVHCTFFHASLMMDLRSESGHRSTLPD